MSRQFSMLLATSPRRARLPSPPTVLQRGANLRSGSMQEDALTSLGNPENVTDLGRIQSFDVSQRDDRALARGEVRDGRLQALQGLTSQEQVLRILYLPTARWVQPATLRRESIGEFRFLVFRGLQSGKRENVRRRPSRAPRVRARFTRIRKIQVFNEERPSNHLRPLMTPSQVSWTTSSAAPRSATKGRASRSKEP